MYDSISFVVLQFFQYIQKGSQTLYFFMLKQFGLLSALHQIQSAFRYDI